MEWPDAGRRDEFAGADARTRAKLVADARRILGDAHEAEDVAQEAILRSAGAGASARSPRAWLLVACRRLAFDRLRGRDAARRALERLAAMRAADDADRGAAAPAARAAEGRDERRRMLDALIGLRDPYRTAVALR